MANPPMKVNSETTKKKKDSSILLGHPRNKNLSKMKPRKKDKKGQLQSIVKSPFNLNSKIKEKHLTLKKSIINYPLESFINKQLSYFDETYSILTNFLKILNNFIDIYHFSVTFKNKKTNIKTDNTYPLQLSNNDTFSRSEINNETLLILKDDNKIKDSDFSLLSLSSSLSTSVQLKSFYYFIKLFSNDLINYYCHTYSSLEMVFLFLVEKFKLSFLMMFISSFQRKTFPLTFEINESFINSKLNEKFIVFFHQFYSKFLYLLLRTCYVKN